MSSFSWTIVGCAAVISTVCAWSLAQGSGGDTSVKAPPPAPAPAEPMPVSPELALPAEPAEGQWQIEFAAGELRLYVDPESAQSYWYFTYKAVNRTGQDRWWASKMELLDDHGRLQRSGKDIPVIVAKRIQALIGNPLIEDQYQILGEIHQGEANAKEGFVVWNAAPLDATELHVFIRGLSSEFKRVADPKGGAEVVMHKTMKRDYRIPGEPQASASTPLVCEHTQWVLR
ncbi:MAG: hypothetical protein EXS17_00425 [Phycisphaerales bacterium]|nr:hypothetical protein [Phycisphaerales bacterium]